jgi:hypothetical protein
MEYLKISKYISHFLAFIIWFTGALDIVDKLVRYSI